MAKETTIKGVEFTIVNTNTKQAEQMIRNYNYSNSCWLCQAYGRYSDAKERAENKILDEMQKIGGYSYRITGAGSCYFSCAYRLDHEGKKYLVYHTPSYRYLIELA